MHPVLILQQQVKLSVLCNAHINNGTQSNFHTAAVSVVGFFRVSSVTVELLCDARCDTTQVLLQKKKKKKLCLITLQNIISEFINISDCEKRACWGRFSQHHNCLNLENVV